MRKNVIAVLTLIAFGVLGASGILWADHDDDEDGEHRYTGHTGRKREVRLRRDEGGGLRSLPSLTNAKWKVECSSCHTLFHPGLLPERSWKKMMAGLSDHFGEDASIDPALNREITDFLVAHSSDKQESRRSSKINRSIPASDTPLRITETAYFNRKHDEISPRTWKRRQIGSPANCIACHGAGAERGIFDEELVKIPKGP